MPFHRDSRTGRPGRVRPTSRASARPRAADGVITLYVVDGEQVDGELPPPSAPTESMPEDERLAHVLLERDRALEEVAYLEEQLRSLSAYHIHLLDEERQRMFDERTQLATELAVLREELQRRAYPGGSTAWSTSVSPATAPDGSRTGGP